MPRTWYGAGSWTQKMKIQTTTTNGHPVSTTDMHSTMKPASASIADNRSLISTPTREK